MKKLRCCLIFMVAFAAGMNNVSGQGTTNSEPQELRRFGIGLNLVHNFSDLLFYQNPIRSQLIFTYNINDHLRIEPDVGYEMINHHYDSDNRTRKESQLSVGLSGYGLVYRNPVCFYYGLNVGYLHYRETTTGPTTGKTTGKGVNIGPAIGLDYFISPHFSLGADFRLLYTAELRKIDYDVDDAIKTEIRYKQLDTLAGLKFRFYF